MKTVSIDYDSLNYTKFRDVSSDSHEANRQTEYNARVMQKKMQ